MAKGTVFAVVEFRDTIVGVGDLARDPLNSLHRCPFDLAFLAAPSETLFLTTYSSCILRSPLRNHALKLRRTSPRVPSIPLVGRTTYIPLHTPLERLLDETRIFLPQILSHWMD